VVFNGAKAACVACHKIGYVGGTAGPDLTRIGAIRTDRDLLDSVLFPSAAFVRGYESVKVSTKDGRDFTGLLKVDAPDEVVLVVAADKEVRLPRADIEEVKPGTVSVMPAGLDQQLTKQELADLIAFLRACK
jgi:putative heme-binding domain-containing protein